MLTRANRVERGSVCEDLRRSGKTLGGETQQGERRHAIVFLSLCLCLSSSVCLSVFHPLPLCLVPYVEDEVVLSASMLPSLLLCYHCLPCMYVLRLTLVVSGHAPKLWSITMLGLDERSLVSPPPPPHSLVSLPPPLTRPVGGTRPRCHSEQSPLFL